MTNIPIKELAYTKVEIAGFSPQPVPLDNQAVFVTDKGWILLGDDATELNSLTPILGDKLYASSADGAEVRNFSGDLIATFGAGDSVDVSFEGEVNGRDIAADGQTLDDLGNTVSNLDTALGNALQEIDDLQTDFGNLSTSVGNNASAISGLSNNLSSLETSHNSLSTTVGNIQTAITGIEDDITVLQNDFSGLDSTVTTIENTILTLDGRVDTAEDNIVDILDTLTDIDNTLSGLANVATSGSYADLSGTPDLTIYNLKHPATRTVTGTSDTLVLADDGGYVRCTNGSAVSATIPPNSSVAFPLGAIITIRQAGAGQVTLVAGAGVTLNGNLKTAEQNASIQAHQVALNVWDITGGVA